MLNEKGSSGLAHQAPKPEHLQPLQPLQPHPQLSLDRADSPHGSEHSRYSAHAMNGMEAPRPYGSPASMQHPMHLGDPNLPPSSMVLPGMPHNMAALQPGLSFKAEAAQPPPKAYPCSTCKKAFARRSDLARHGKRTTHRTQRKRYSNELPQSVFTPETVHMSAIFPIAGSSSFSGQP